MSPHLAASKGASPHDKHQILHTQSGHGSHIVNGPCLATLRLNTIHGDTWRASRGSSVHVKDAEYLLESREAESFASILSLHTK